MSSCPIGTSARQHQKLQNFVSNAFGVGTGASANQARTYFLAGRVVLHSQNIVGVLALLNDCALVANTSVTH